MNFKKVVGIIIGLGLFNVILFADFLMQIHPIFKMIDELIPVVLGIYTVIKLIKYKFKLKDISHQQSINLWMICFCLVGVAILGILGNYVYAYQSLVPIVSDMIVVFKGFITYVCATLLFTDDILEDYKLIINILLRGITIAFALLVLMNYVYPIYPIEGERLGISSQQLMFSAPTYLATFGVCLVVLLSRFLGDYKGNIYFIILANLVIASTLRSKALMFIAVYFFLFVFLIIFNKKLTKKVILVIALLGVLVGGYQIKTYVENPDWARSALMINSFKVANDHFPLGSGFATFATWESGESYSPLYERYGLNTIWGLQEDDYSFVGDTYWPAIIGQFGYFGLLFILMVIYKIYQTISLEENKFKYFQRLVALVYLLILSTSETSFMSPVGPLLCLLMVI